MVERVGSIAQRLAEKPYAQRVCRVENYPGCLLPEFPYVGVSVEEYADLIHRAGVEVQIIAGEIDRGTPRFPSTMIPPHPDAHRDRLPTFLKLAHERGIVVLTYYSMNYCKPLKPLHPEWLMQFLDDGRPPTENLGWFCFNSPYRDWLPDYLTEFLDHLDLDGFYFDDMNWGSHEDHPYYPSCCCAHCARLWRDETGTDIPTRVDLDSRHFRRFMVWRYAKMQDYLHHIARRVKAKYPDAIIDYNYYGRARADWSYGHPLNPLHLEDVGAHFFIETDVVRDGTSFTAKVARAHGSPFAIWRHAMQTLPEVVISSAPYPEPFSPTLHGLSTLANGGGAVFGMFDGPQTLRHAMMKALFDQLKPRVAYMGGETVKHVALHCSQQTRDFHRPQPGAAGYGQGAAAYGRMVKGVYEMLNQSHLLTDVVFDEQLTPSHLAAYPVLFLANSVCLSDAQADAVRHYVHNGGTLVATHETSLADELGQPRDDFLLADVFGVDYVGPRADRRVHGVVYLTHDAALSSAPGDVIAFAAEDAQVALRPAADVSVLCTRSSLGGDRPLDGYDHHAPQDSGEPAVTVHRYGRGEAIYIGGDVGSAYTHNPYPPLKRFVAHLVQRQPSPLTVDAPNTIEVAAAWRSATEMVIHLVNNPTPLLPWSAAGEQANTHFYLEEVNPVHDVRLRFNSLRVKSARLPLSDRPLAVTGQPPTITVPGVHLHEVVLVEVDA